MQRCKKTDHAARYPHIKAFLDRYARRAGVGLVAGVVATSAGCDWLTGGVLTPKPDDDTGQHLDGMGPDTAETWSLALPLHGARDLYFADPWGWIRYRLELVVDGTPLYDWLRQNPDEALAVIDAALAADPVTAYAEDDGYDEAEQRIVTALMQAWQDTSGGGAGHIVDIALIIDAYEDQDDITGDIEAAR